MVPREFVFIERAAIGLGGAFLRLGARLNFHRLYEDAIADFDVDAVARRQAEGLKAVGLKALQPRSLSEATGRDQMLLLRPARNTALEAASSISVA